MTVMAALRAILLIIFFVPSVSLAGNDVQEQARQKIIEVLRSAGLDKELDAKVMVAAGKGSALSISDGGNYFMQYVIVGPDKAGDAEVVIDGDVDIPASCDKMVVVTHGWFDKGQSSWPADVAAAIGARVDPNEWVCCYFDWQGGANVVTPVEAAMYGRDIGGARLAKAVLKLAERMKKLTHVHLIGHSAGSWVVNSAARAIAAEKAADLHLTFLDAYVPPLWKKELAEVEVSGKQAVLWAEHYYSKDITFESTQEDLPGVWNVDVTAIDTGIAEHEFPYKWYYATVAGKYRNSDPERGQEVIRKAGQIECGFGRSLEAGAAGWEVSKSLKTGGKALQMRGKKIEPLFKGWK